MTNTRLLDRSAFAAIAAVLALSPTQAFAQDAATPPIVLPGEEVAAPVVAPIVIAPAPVVVPEIIETRTQNQPAAATSRRAVTAAASSQSIPNAAPPVRVETPSVTQADLTDPIIAPLAEPMAANVAARTELEVAPAAAESGDQTAVLAQILAGLLAASAAIAAILFLRRRRRPRDSDALMTPVVAERQPAYAPIPVGEPVRASPRIETPQPAKATSAALPTAGAAVALPLVAPTDQTERTNLLKKMIAARPDRANPFRSPKARLHRARLILQSLGRKFENARPRIDLSQYTSNWPALARYNRTAMA